MIFRLFIFALIFQFLNATLPEEIERFIEDLKIKRENLSILIKDEGNNGEVIASLNEKKPFTPASIAKIPTCYGALLELGKDYRWPTQFFYTGRVQNGILKGDIIVKAFGDPTITAKDVRRFARKIASFGINEIRGNIVIDRTFFKDNGKISAKFDKNPVSEYNAMPDAMMVNRHLNSIKIIPREGGAEVIRLYGDKSFDVVNKIRVVNKSCRGQRRYPATEFLMSKDNYNVVLKGELSSQCKPFYISKVLSRSYKSFYYMLRHYLDTEGVVFNGKPVLKKVPKNAKLLFTHFSKPLLKIVEKTLKTSNNLYARHIFLLLGAKRYGPPANIYKSQRALRDILSKRGLIKGRFIIENGSGLSRRAKVNAITIEAINRDAYRNYGTDWLHALSIAGVDGTTKKRFRNSIVKNRAFMKTGTLRKIKNIAGFVEPLDDTEDSLYNVVIFYKGHKTWLGKSLQNKIITWLVKRGF